MTRGCTLHGFLTCETPCTPLPIPADYPDPCRGYGFLEGTGIGHREVTRGLPVPITTKTEVIDIIEDDQAHEKESATYSAAGPSKSVGKRKLAECEFFYIF